MNTKTIWSRACRGCALVASLLAAPLWGANLVSVSDGASTTEYATIEAALAACAGGETLTLLGNVTVAGGLSVTKPVAVDLAGHTLKNNSGAFIAPAPAADGLSFRNGTIIAENNCFGFTAGSYTVSVSNVAFEGVCVLYGSGGTLEFQDGCLARTRTCFVSSWSNGGCGCNVRGGVVACANIYDNMTHPGTKLTVTGGSFVADPTIGLAPGYIAEVVDHDAQGVACHYRVRAVRPEEQGVASVTAADGTVRYCANFAEAVSTCTPGSTLTLLQDCPAVSEIALAADVVIDLNGHALSRSTYGYLFMSVTGSRGVTVRNGSCRAPTGMLVGTQTSCGPIVFSNCTLEAHALFHGNGLSATLSDCRTVSDYFVSRESSGTVNVDGGSHAVRIARNNGYATAAKLDVTGGRFGFDVTDGVAEGFVQVCEEVVDDGVAYRFAVRPEAEVAGYPGAVAFSADGVQSNAYATIADAVAACPAGGRVRALRNCKVNGSLTVPRSMKLELNGLRLENAGYDFLKLAAGATLDVDGGGGTLFSWGSIFWLNNADTTVNVTNCVLQGNCPLFGGASGTANFHAGTLVANMLLLASGNGSATLNIHGGHYQFGRWRDNANLSTGTSVHIFGGRFAVNPLQASARNPDVVAPDHRTFFEQYTYLDQTFYHVVLPDAETADWTVEATFQEVAYTNVSVALAQARPSAGTVVLQADIGHAAKFADDADTAGGATLDLNGHGIRVPGDVFQVGKNKSLTLRGGTLAPTTGSKSCITLMASSKLTAESTVSLEGASGLVTCGFYLPGAGAQAVLDGTSVSTSYMFSWSGSAAGASVTVRGDGTNTCQGIFWPGTKLPAGCTLAICGGWWRADPTAYVPANHLKLRYADAPVCTWRIQPWADICAKGWTFDTADGTPVVTGPVDAAPASPVVVSVVGGVPQKKTALADLRGLSVASGTLTADSFVCDPDWPKSAHLLLEDGVLSVVNSLGSVLVIR